MELSIWIKGSLSRGRDIPLEITDQIGAARRVLEHYASTEFQHLIEQGNLPADFLNRHINAFFDGLAGEDRDHRYSWESDGMRDVRVLIENVSPETIRHQSAMMEEFLAEVSNRPQPAQRMSMDADGNVTYH